MDRGTHTCIRVKSRQVISAGKATFEVQTGHPDGNVEINIKSPSKRQVKYTVVYQHKGIYRVEFCNLEVGTYVIDVLYETIPITGSPFMVKSFDVGRTFFRSVYIGQTSKFISSNEPRSKKIIMWNEVMTGNVSLDLAFTIDFSGSMKSHMEKACQIIKDIVTSIQCVKVHNGFNFRLALVKYRDHGSSYVTEVTQFTEDYQRIVNSFDHCHVPMASVSDYAEAVEDALYDTEKLDWRPEAKKICVLIGDAPAHGLITGSKQEDRFQKDGCPLMRDAMVITNDMAKRGITLHVIGCGKAAADYRNWFTALAHITGGQFLSLASANNLKKVLVAGIMTKLSPIDTEKVVRREIQLACSATERIDDKSALIRRIHQILKEEGISTVHVRYIGGRPEPSEFAKNLAKCRTMSEARSVFRTNEVHAKDVSIELEYEDISEYQVGLMFNKIMKSMEFDN